MQKWKFIFSFKGVDNYQSMKQSKFTDQPKVTYWSLQKVTIVLVIASKSVHRFYRSLENVPIVLLTTSKKFPDYGFNVSKHEKNNAFAAPISYLQNNANIDCTYCASDVSITRENNAFSTAMTCFRNFVFAFLLKRIYLRHLDKRTMQTSIVENVQPMLPNAKE